MGSMKDGIVPQLDFSEATTAEDVIDVIIAAIPDPDTTSTSGAQQGIIGFLDEMSPLTAAQLIVELEAAKDSDAFGGTGESASGSHTVTADEVTATEVLIETGIPNITLANGTVSIWRAGTNVTADAVITEDPAGTIKVEDGAVTYNLTAGDIINWFART